MEKSPLNVMHSSAQAIAEIESVNANSEGGQLLKASVSVHGEGFKKVNVTLKRSVNRASTEETVGELTSGMETFTWKPNVRNFDVILVTYSNMNQEAFLNFLKYLGAETHSSILGLDSYVNKGFTLCDGSTMAYTLRMNEEKHILGHERDENYTYFLKETDFKNCYDLF